MKIEIAAFSVEAALMSTNAGADRIELCCSYLSGGLTPGIATFRKVREQAGIPVFVLIRPREGDFVYSSAEYEVLLDEVRMFADEGADGIVTGVLTPERMPDRKRLEQIRKVAGTLPLTFHRAFDFTADPFTALHVIQECGVNRILSSGQEASAPKGFSLLKMMAAESRGNLIILPGGGFDDTNINEFIDCGLFPELHLSAKKRVSAAPPLPETRVNLSATAEMNGDSHVVPDVEMIRRIRKRITD